MWKRILLPVTVVGAVTLVGCSSSEDAASPTADGGSQSHLAEWSTEPPQVSDDVRRDDLTHERVVEWTHYDEVAENQLRFFFMAGTPSCYGSRAVVEESGTAVSVAVIEGTLPDAPDACTDEGRFASLLVETDAPVGEREVLPLTDPDLH